MSNPYASLDSSKFWKTGTSDLGQISQSLWCPKNKLDKETPILTVGSCFAQHISNALIGAGFNWLNAEPAPNDMVETEAKENGYNIFSFRIGNIYTVRLLRQWIEWAFDIKEDSKEIVFENGRYYDPFRPQFPPNGFKHECEIFDARQKTYLAIRQGFAEAGLFIFTLGLTEAWGDTDGNYYPSCPGTIRGTFSPQKHFFKNFNYSEIAKDIEWVFSFLKTVNKELTFLLTVSPVPLTATASEDHVLVATTYSKSVLRAVSGEISQIYRYVDYFPSYEIIASHPIKAVFYESNLRSVKPDGVAFVMKNFLAGYIKDKRNVEAVPISETDCEPEKDSQVICEDIILENWNSAITGHAPSSVPKILLAGDSHMGKLASALIDYNICYAGGGITDGSVFHSCQFLLDGKYGFLLTDPVGRDRWMTTVDALNLDFRDNEKVSDTILVTNIGMHSHMFIEGGGFIQYLNIVYGTVPNTVSIDDVNRYLITTRQPLFDILKAFAKKFERVVFVTDPPVQIHNIEIHTMFEAALHAHIQALGIKVFHARQWINQAYGLLPDDFIGDDVIHGSDLYYKSIASEIIC